MYKIYKITSNTVVDFAAEELKKYLRMMMPYCGEIKIEYRPDAVDGFRLGLMSDYGIPTDEAEDVELDDIVHIDTDSEGGVIAGDNPRSVLLAVYRYLTINGCRWLYPGIDGEFIPVKNVEPTKYHKLADNRYRGQCNEGAEYQPDMMASIDFTPKIGMNIFMIEFENPWTYYNSYYNHIHNTTHRIPEPVDKETVLQWKRQCEAEIAKRGLQFHDMGHGWTAEAFNIDSSMGWGKAGDNAIPEDMRQYVAKINGERQLFGGVPLNTNFCMSNPVARKMVAKKVADYAESATNVDYLHVWLSDATNNHCECEKCREKITSDWYAMLMNDIDEELTARGLDTRIVFISYTDTTWSSETVTIKNPKRFSLLMAAIFRNYTECVSSETVDESRYTLTEYNRNHNTFPESVNEALIHAKRWRERNAVKNLVYEYHFWVPQYMDLGLFDSARLIYDDIRGYKANGCSGIIEDGSQRSFFPNGFSYFVYGSTLFDSSVDFEELKEDYFSHAYGEDWREVEEFFKKLGKAADFRWTNGRLSKDPEGDRYYNPEMAESYRKVADIVAEFAPFVEAHMNMPKRPQTVSMRILNRYLEYAARFSEILAIRAEGKPREAKAAVDAFWSDFGKYELEIEPYYDHYMAAKCTRRIFFIPEKYSTVD